MRSFVCATSEVSEPPVESKEKWFFSTAAAVVSTYTILSAHARHLANDEE